MQPLSVASEEQLVAELETRGVHYLARQDSVQVARARSAQCLLADLVRQPTSRVRMALISLLLAHPNFGQAAPASLPALTKEQRSQLKLLYTAALLLQKEHAERLQSFLGDEWSWLPDWFSAELNLPPGTPQEQLQTLARLQQQQTGMTLNWVGTFENAAHLLLHRWELESEWSR